MEFSIYKIPYDNLIAVKSVSPFRVYQRQRRRGLRKLLEVAIFRQTAADFRIGDQFNQSINQSIEVALVAELLQG